MATPDQATGVSDADITGTVIEAIDSFDAMGLSEPLLRGIYAYGFEKPSAIQQRAIKPLMSGQDTIAQAQSGTGKTAAFGIGVLQTVDIEDRRTQALILAPTRELALQIQKVVVALGDYLKISCAPALPTEPPARPNGSAAGRPPLGSALLRTSRR